MVEDSEVGDDHYGTDAVDVFGIGESVFHPIHEAPPCHPVTDLDRTSAALLLLSLLLRLSLGRFYVVSVENRRTLDRDSRATAETPGIKAWGGLDPNQLWSPFHPEVLPGDFFLPLLRASFALDPNGLEDPVSRSLLQVCCTSDVAPDALVADKTGGIAARFATIGSALTDSYTRPVGPLPVPYTARFARRRFRRLSVGRAQRELSKQSPKE